MRAQFYFVFRGVANNSSSSSNKGKGLAAPTMMPRQMLLRRLLPPPFEALPRMPTEVHRCRSAQGTRRKGAMHSKSDPPPQRSRLQQHHASRHSRWIPPPHPPPSSSREWAEEKAAAPPPPQQPPHSPPQATRAQQIQTLPIVSRAVLSAEQTLTLALCLRQHRPLTSAAVAAGALAAATTMVPLTRTRAEVALFRPPTSTAHPQRSPPAAPPQQQPLPLLFPSPLPVLGHHCT